MLGFFRCHVKFFRLRKINFSMRIVILSIPDSEEQS